MGIGTVAPSSNLHVTGAPANGTYLSYLYNSGTHNSSHGLNVQTASSNIAAYGLRVNTGGDSNALAVMGTGGVGIGTSSPASKLHIRTSTNFNYEFEEVSSKLRLSALIDARDTNVPLEFAASSFGFLTGAATFAGNILMGNTVVNPASGFSDQTGIGLKYSATVPELQVSSDSTALQLGRTSTGGSGQIMAMRAASTTVHDFRTTYYSTTGWVDAANFKIGGAQGSDGQVLTSTGSGVAWEGNWTPFNGGTIGATTITSTTNLLLTLNPTAGDYGGISVSYTHLTLPTKA